MINKLAKIVLFSLFMFLFSLPGNATHMVGGDFSYRCLGNGYFEITLTIRRDCKYGAADAFFDDRAVVTVFDQSGVVSSIHNNGVFYLPYFGNDTLNESLDVECGILGDKVCVHEAIYRDTIFLPRPKEGQVYFLEYQRCCRNQTLLNIDYPLETGGSYIIRIDRYDYDNCNSSPAFKQWPPIYICANKKLTFDHSAVDPDGDSLVYKLYTPFSGATKENPRPRFPNEYTPLFDTVHWADGYGLGNILGGSDPLRIDPHTGLLTGTPERLGQFLVGVKVEEYRDGRLLSTVFRDFEFNVRACVESPVASFESVDAICGSGINDTLVLTNTSQFADSYTWTIYQHSNGQTYTYTTTDVDFAYTLPAAGKDTFDIILEAYSEVAGCSEIYQKTIIAVKDELNVDFKVDINDCYKDSLDITLQLVDLFDQLNPLYTWKSSQWRLIFSNDTLYADGKEVKITIPKEKSAWIRLTVLTEEKCEASIEKKVSLDFADIEFIADPLVLCKGDSSKIISNPHSDWTYTWQPETGLIFDDPADKSDPTFIANANATYIVTVTDGICTDIDTIDIFVRDYFDVSIEGPDTVCSDSVLLKVAGVPADDTLAEFEWADDVAFANIIAEGREVILPLNKIFNTFYLRVKENTGCSNNIDSLTVINGMVNLQYDKEIKYCTNNNARIRLINKTPGLDITVHWEDSPLIVRGQDSLTCIIYTETTGEYDLVFHASTEYGCELTDTIHIKADEGPVLTLNNNIECGTYTMCFNVSGGDLSSYDWDFGVPDSDADTSHLEAPCFDYQKPGLYHVAVEVLIESCGGLAYLEKDVLIPEILDLDLGGDTLVYCQGEEVTVIANKNASATIKWYAGNNLVGEGDTLVFKPQGDFELIALGSDIYGCLDTATIFMDEYDFDVTFVDPGTRCKGDTLQLEIINNSGANLSYEWHGDNIIAGANTNKPTVVLNQSYQFEVKITDNDYGCDSLFYVNVVVSDIDVGLEADTTTIVITNSTKIRVVDLPEEYTILWSTGETTEEITVSPQTSREYCVTVTDGYGCTDTECITIKVVDPACDDTDIYVPNAFSPNGDGNNDVFRVRGWYVRSVEMEIYDRWGELIFKGSGDENLHWDGTFRGKELPPDSYIFRVRVVCEDTDNWSKVGNVSLIK